MHDFYNASIGDLQSRLNPMLYKGNEFLYNEIIVFP